MERNLRVLAWSLSSVSVAVACITVVLAPLVGESISRASSAALVMGAFPLVGALVVSRHPRNTVGWVFIAGGFLHAWNVLAGRYAQLGLLAEPHVAWPAAMNPIPRSDPFPLAAEAAWFHHWTWFPSLAGLVIFVPLLFPDGRPPLRRWRLTGWAGLAAIAMVIGPLAVATWPIRGPLLLGDLGSIPDLNWIAYPTIAGFLLAGAAAISSAIALVFRFKKSRGVERQQLAGFVFANTILLVVAVNAFSPWSLPEWALTVAVVGVVVATGLAILRYRLYDIDLVISRSLVYVILSGLVATLYIGVVAMFGRLFESRGLMPALVATGLVAVVFSPLRERLQRGVSRLLYGERDDPYLALSRLGKRLEAAVSPQEVIRLIVETIAQGLRVPYVGIELRHDEGLVPAETHGEPVADSIDLPLVHQRETVGRLAVGRRSPGESFSAADMRLIEDLAHQAGVAVYAVRLMSDLQHSRERLVVAREEERRRLRRLLHDGIGPTLAGIVLQVETVRSLVGDAHETADALLAQLKAEIMSAVADVRRIAYDLRPPALDDLGLVGALREEGGRFAANGRGLLVSIEAPDDLPVLPAAVEVAAYRIALEGLTNAARHAEARTCLVRFVVREGLELEVRDDGCGLPRDFRPGVGVWSMRERAAELGGTLTIETVAPTGTRIIARLPVAQR